MVYSVIPWIIGPLVHFPPQTVKKPFSFPINRKPLFGPPAKMNPKAPFGFLIRVGWAKEPPAPVIMDKVAPAYGTPLIRVDPPTHAKPSLLKVYNAVSMRLQSSQHFNPMNLVTIYIRWTSHNLIFL
jgi:hypothetical protein